MLKSVENTQPLEGEIILKIEYVKYKLKKYLFIKYSLPNFTLNTV